MTENTPFESMCRTWQPVALARDLAPGGVSGFTIFDREIVVARLPDGLLVVDNACPHKGMRLSKASVQNGELVCCYHGWRFGGDGRCTAIPSLPDASANKLASARLQSYAVQERYGFIWVQMEPNQQEQLPHVPEFENANWSYLTGPPTAFGSGWRREVENFLDMTHFAFAHAKTLGQAADTCLPEMQIETRDGGFTMRTEFPALKTLHEQPGKLSSGHARYYQTWLPNFTVIRQSWPDGDERLLLHVPTPNTRESCTVFWALAISPGFDGPPAQEQLAFAVRVLEEDRQMCENQRPLEVPLNPSKGGWGVLVAPGDTLANTFQKSLRQWLVKPGLVEPGT